MGFATKEQIAGIINVALDRLVTIRGSAGYDLISSISVFAATPRWLTFDPLNKKGLKINGNVFIRRTNGIYLYLEDGFTIDFSNLSLVAGQTYLINLSDSGEFTVSTSALKTGVTIGRFHTLCVNVGNSATMKIAAKSSSGIQVGDSYLVKPYSEEFESDFYNLYNCEVTSVTPQTDYDLITCEHPLTGYQAGDILPESIFSLSFKPDCLFADAMVYDKSTDIAVDVYLQSGTGSNTRSVYNATHTITRSPFNYLSDLNQVGKRMLTDYEFTSIALGSNEKSVINGAADVYYVGGHSDSNGNRMISAIGCEECCGYLFQCIEEVSSPGDSGNFSLDWTSSIATSDGQGSFGKEFWTPRVGWAGGAYDSTATDSGSMCREFRYFRSTMSASMGCRGCTNLVIKKSLLVV